MGGPGKVLVVENDAVARARVAVVLGAAGYAVTQAATGREALQALRAGPAPGLILLDILMPAQDGWHFLRQLRQEDRAAAVPVVLATAADLTREWAAAHGCAGF